MKGFRFTLNEASDILKMIGMNNVSCRKVYHTIENKVTALDEKIHGLIQIKTRLLNGLKICEGDYNPVLPDDNCRVLVKGVI